MRLIDADALLKGKQDHEMISTHIVWNAPTIEAEPIRHGHWDYVEEFFADRWWNTYRCSVCGHQEDFEEPYRMKYCPECGAKMDEPMFRKLRIVERTDKGAKAIVLKKENTDNCGAKMDESDTYSVGHNTNDTIATVESNEDKLRSMLHDCRNELCLNCGLYKSAYQGACDNCRWASGKEWDKI